MRKVLVLVLKYNWLTRTVKLKDEFPHGFSHIAVSFHAHRQTGFFKNQNSYFCCEVLQWFTVLSVREVA